MSCGEKYNVHGKKIDKENEQLPKFDLTEHTTEHIKREQERARVYHPNRISQMIKDKQLEEERIINDSAYANAHPRFQGICANPGNAFFSNTPVEVPSYSFRYDPSRRYGNMPYDTPMQHPLYTTTNGEYGQQPTYTNFSKTYYPKDQTFSKAAVVGGCYQDNHLTTELDNKPIIGRRHKKTE